MAIIRSFKELRVWQNAMDAAMLVFELTKRFPPEEKYSLTDQFRKASRSVAANISEAWRKRRYPAAFVSKLNDAEGEAAEAQTWIEFALRCKYMKAGEANDLDQRYEQILGQLVVMIERPDYWVVGARREHDTEKGRHGDAASKESPSLRVLASPCQSAERRQE
jgi:four helix bundle protein